jgi:hypothetical protein
MGRIRRFLPSPAMIVAVVALVMSLSGGAVRKDKLGGGAIKESTLGAVPVSFLSSGGTRFAVVNAGGQAVRGRDISSVARTSEGRYQVIFNTNVRSCGYFATIGDASASAPPQNSQISVSSLGTNVNGVAVRTENGANGNELDRSFHLIVMC